VGGFFGVGFVKCGCFGVFWGLLCEGGCLSLVYCVVGFGVGFTVGDCRVSVGFGKKPNLPRVYILDEITRRLELLKLEGLSFEDLTKTLGNTFDYLTAYSRTAYLLMLYQTLAIFFVL
jgi:hypothetical protein